MKCNSYDGSVQAGLKWLCFPGRASSAGRVGLDGSGRWTVACTVPCGQGCGCVNYLAIMQPGHAFCGCSDIRQVQAAVSQRGYQLDDFCGAKYLCFHTNNYVVALFLHIQFLTK